LKIAFLAIPFGALVSLGLDDRREKSHPSDVFVDAQMFEEGLDVQPLPLWAMNEDTLIPVKCINIDCAAFLGRRRKRERERLVRHEKGLDIEALLTKLTELPAIAVG